MDRGEDWRSRLWRFLGRFRSGSLVVIALALVALAVLQEFCKTNFGVQVRIGEVTKVLFAVVCVIIARTVQDNDRDGPAPP